MTNGLAMTCRLLVAIDIDPSRLHHGRHDISVHGVGGHIEVILGDAMSVLPTLKAGVVFLSPPWGGPASSESPTFDLDTMIPAPLCPKGIFEIRRQVTPIVAFYLPRKVNPEQVASIPYGHCHLGEVGGL
ncbi:unnamed protein product [Discosporangium mesarthrocarpum]